jgi:hypothetical protein
MLARVAAWERFVVPRKKSRTDRQSREPMVQLELRWRYVPLDHRFGDLRSLVSCFGWRREVMVLFERAERPLLFTA